MKDQARRKLTLQGADGVYTSEEQTQRVNDMCREILVACFDYAVAIEEHNAKEHGREPVLAQVFLNFFSGVLTAQHILSENSVLSVVSSVRQGWQEQKQSIREAIARSVPS